MKLTTLLAAVAAVAPLVAAGTFHEVPRGKISFVPNAYIVEYEQSTSRTVAHNNFRTHRIQYNVRKEFDVFHGAALTIKSGHEGDALANIPGVKNVWRVTVNKIPQLTAAVKGKKGQDVLAASLHQMTGMDVVRKRYKLTGKGIKIGIIDSGIDYKHPAFAAKGASEGCFARYGKNCRVKYGWDFVGDKYDGYNTPTPDADPMDCRGHGTHVAGIIGADALDIKGKYKPPQPFVGVAPEVTIGAYRIFGCKGDSGTDVVMAAMEMAFNDGMDVINISLGGGSSYKYNPQAVLAEKLIAHGMSVVAAGGNDGGDGPWMVMDIGLSDKTSSVASFDNTYGLYFSFSYGGKMAYPYMPAETYGYKPLSLPSSATLVPIFEKDGSLSDGCDPSRYKGVEKKVVLVLGDYSRCTAEERGNVSISAGAVAMVFQTTPIGMEFLIGVPEFPMASIENWAGDELIKTYKKNSKTKIDWNKKESNFRVEAGGAPSDFSSFGLDGELRSKPDLSAPGGNILSTVPRSMGGYMLQSGTSMSAPYVAGAHAIYMQAKKKTMRGDFVRQAFKNTATISSNLLSRTKASVAKQGAGLINVLSAIEATSSISPDHIDLLDSKHLRRKVQITIKNSGKHTETYRLSHIPADALNAYPTGNSFPIGDPLIEKDYASVSFSHSKIKIRPGQSTKVTLSFTEPKKGKSNQFPIYSGFVVATPLSKKSIAVHVPYTGVKGDIAKVPIMDKDLGFPGLVLVDNEGNLKEIPSKDYVFDLTNEFPAVMDRLGSHTPDLTFRIYKANSAQTKNTKLSEGDFIGYMLSENMGPGFGWAGRHKNKDMNGNLVYDVWIWGGKVLPKRDPTLKPAQLSSGTYRVVVASQRKLSKGIYPRDFEVYDLGTTTLGSLSK
ncbi:hypothetical protein BGW38_002511 [Lunasporangiospora selenospora]|uniref:Uncharacterized protein n=1 Tax=Lunasporangiospora selenospora TaxID=979761 RepID=A0A9P6KDB9_9FUNG|nr:hypothetical protein BGW38_002511 [Lunasporangiospora selenospora]